MKPDYRADIDGLRAVAVLLVIGFHAFPKYVVGGFVGVDVFFVISGFLISSLIFKGLKQREFSFADFYARRVRRIFPALILVLFATLGLGWLILFASDFRELGKHTAAAAGSVANLAYLQEAGYFDSSADLKPLLHLWSLGVEEQFYIVWPLLMVLAWPYRRAPAAVAATILVISFVWCVVLTATNALAAFYLPFTRFWELMIGCILAYAATSNRAIATGSTPLGRLRGQFQRQYQRYEGSILEAAAWFGVALIFASAALIDSKSPFPGWMALMPTIGAMLVIFAGDKASINRRVLSHRVLVYVGLISYPLYLWHWPILAFLRDAYFKEPSDLLRVGAVALSFALAHWTYRYVERPIRYGPALSFKPIGASIALALAGGFGLLIYASNGVPGRFPPQAELLLRDFKAEALASSRFGSCFIVEGSGSTVFPSQCDAPSRGQAREIVLWGDSHAAHLFAGLHALAEKEPTLGFAQYTAAGCPPVSSVVSIGLARCKAINAFAVGKIAQRKPDTVIVAAHWGYYDGTPGRGRIGDEDMRQTVSLLRSAGVSRVVAVGQFPLWRAAPPKILALHYRRQAWGLFASAAIQERNSSFLEPSMFASHERSHRLLSASGATVLSPLSSLCAQDGCYLVVPDGSREPMSWDYGHLTKAGSIFFAAANGEALVGR